MLRSLLTDPMFLLTAVGTFAFVAAALSTAAGQVEETIVDEWAAIKAPPPPELQSVTVDPKTMALLMLDLQNQNCDPERRPRAVASLPKIQALLTESRRNGMPVVYSLTRSATKNDIRSEVAALPAEPAVQAGVDKFYGTDLQGILRSRGVQTVIIVGTSAHGAVLHTAAGAALRGFNVIVPVDGMSADDPYAEQYTAWHLANSPATRSQTTLTRIGLIRF